MKIQYPYFCLNLVNNIVMRLLTLMQINIRPKLTNNSFFNRSTSSQSQCGHIPSSKSHSSSIGNGSSSGRYRESANSAGISFIATPTNSSTATLPNMTRSGLNYFTSLRNRRGIIKMMFSLKLKMEYIGQTSRDMV